MIGTAVRNSRQPDLNVPYLVFFFSFEGGGVIGEPRWSSRSLIGRDIFDFFSEIADQNLTQLDWKQDLKALYYVCDFFGRSEIQNGCPWLWLAETCSTSSLKRLNQIQLNFTGCKISNILYHVYVFRADRITRMSLIGWDTFEFSSETTE